MAKPVSAEQSRAIPVPPEEAFAAALSIPLPTLLCRRYGPFPPIKAVEGQTEWEREGNGRTIVPAGGGSMRETLTGVDSPRSFGYAITDITGPMAMLVDRIDGRWSFRPQGTGTGVTWGWTLHPKSALSAPVVPVLARIWHGYARQALESLSDYLLR